MPVHAKVEIEKLPDLLRPGRSMSDVCSQPSMGSLGLNAGVVWLLVRDGLEPEKKQQNNNIKLTFSACVASGKTFPACFLICAMVP